LKVGDASIAAEEVTGMPRRCTREADKYRPKGTSSKDQEKFYVLSYRVLKRMLQVSQHSEVVSNSKLTSITGEALEANSLNDVTSEGEKNMKEILKKRLDEKWPKACVTRVIIHGDEKRKSKKQGPQVGDVEMQEGVVVEEEEEEEEEEIHFMSEGEEAETGDFDAYYEEAFSKCANGCSCDADEDCPVRTWNLKKCESCQMVYSGTSASDDDQHC